jgi:hypothetical protein
VAAIENDHERRALCHAVEQAGGGGHAADVEFAGYERRNGRGAVDKFAVLDFDAELFEIALFARDVLAAAGNERPIRSTHHIGCLRNARRFGADQRERENNTETDVHCCLPAVERN